MDKKPRFVVVDDDETLLDVLKASLATQDYTCQTFSTAETALDHLSQEPCDILITDIVLQGMKGLELTRRVKQFKPDTSVIVMTGFIDDFSYDQAIEAGASDFIKKPFTVKEIIIRIKHVILQEKLREMSNTDELTGLLNRRGFFTIAEQQVKVAARNRGRLALVFADMDGFKTINDTLGHQQGDEALKAMAKIFRKTVRDSDLVARISGDEFALLLLDTSAKNLDIMAKRLHKNIEASNSRKTGTFSLSVSIGIADYDHEKPCSIDELIRLADNRMYEEKKKKKGRG
jgi:diguanylate cyclase (GGDEF)-like protein